jgi:hypothetical protein
VDEEEAEKNAHENTAVREVVAACVGRLALAVER